MIALSDNAAELEKAIEAFAQQIVAGTRGAVAETCEEGAAHARAVGQFKDQTGALRRSIQGRVVRRDQHGTSGVIEATAAHGKYVEDDTRPHEIRPRTAKVLRWEDAGGVHFARRVRHPGTKAKPFMGPAAIRAEGLLRAKVEIVAAHAIARFGR